ncbi:MAG: hypothetical protein NT062_23520 [Proteobacteria bacterium]|nr:hypothetical protein [Pseudomonadota bacterium]
MSRGSMFLKASTPPDIGTTVRIDLSLPSETVIVLTGTVDKHVTDPQRGSGVELKLAPIPETTTWMIESALAAEQKVRAQQPPPPPAGSGKTAQRATPPLGVDAGAAARSSGPSLTDGEDLAKAEQELRDALTSEVESLKKLNPFLVLGVGYEATDSDVRAAFGELTKRYHPDRFARYQSSDLRQIAAEIFILIRDAYRRIGDDTGRVQALQALGRSPAPRAIPMPRLPTTPMAVVTSPPSSSPQPPSGSPPPLPQRTRQIPRIGEPPPQTLTLQTPLQMPPPPPRPTPTPTPTPPPPTPTPTPPPPATTLLPPGVALALPATRSTTPPPMREQQPLPAVQTERRPILGSMPQVIGESMDLAAVEEMLDAGKLDDALAAFKILTKKNPQDRSFRAGIELCEGLKSLAARDRLEAAQRFEAALEIDPGSERAARELAEMRRQATNERKGLLSRLMKKE